MRIQSLFILVGICFAGSTCVLGQIPSATSARRLPTEVELSEARISQLIARADFHFREGKHFLETNKRAKAREEFDKAVDSIIESGFDVRANVRLHTYYLDLIERIYREEIPLSAATVSSAPALVAQNATQQDGPADTRIGFREQRFEAPPSDELSKPIISAARPTNSRSTVKPKAPISLAGQKPAQLKSGQVPAVVRYLYDNLNDPYSMKLLRWSNLRVVYRYEQPFWYVTLRMRAKNGFGAYILREVGFYLRNNKVVLADGF